MQVPQIGGLGSQAPPKISPTTAQPATAAQTAEVHSSQSSSKQSTTVSSMSFMPMNMASKPLALAYMVLMALLQKDDQEDGGQDSFMQGLAAGLLSAEQRDPRMFFSSTRTESSSHTVTGSKEVHAAYTELPKVAADAPGATEQAGQSSTAQVNKIDARA